MKKFLIAAAATTFVATPVFAAPGDGNRADRIERATERPYRSGYQDARQAERRADRRQDARQTQRRVENRQDARTAARAQNRSQSRRWNRGERFDRRQAVNYRAISSPRAYRLNTAPRGYRWVRSGNDAVLVGITSGIVSAIISNAIR